MRPQQIVSLVGIWFLVVGVFGYIGENNQEPALIILPPTGGSTQRLKVIQGTSDSSEAAADNLQGSAQLQKQGSSLQTPIGNQLQPNAGADSLPTDY